MSKTKLILALGSFKDKVEAIPHLEKTDLNDILSSLDDLPLTRGDESGYHCQDVFRAAVIHPDLPLRFWDKCIESAIYHPEIIPPLWMSQILNHKNLSLPPRRERFFKSIVKEIFLHSNQNVSKLLDYKQGGATYFTNFLFLYDEIKKAWGKDEKYKKIWQGFLKEDVDRLFREENPRELLVVGIAHLTLNLLIKKYLIQTKEEKKFFFNLVTPKINDSLKQVSLNTLEYYYAQFKNKGSSDQVQWDYIDNLNYSDLIRKEIKLRKAKSMA